MVFDIEINLTHLGELIRQNPELKRTIKRRDGSEFEVINFMVTERRDTFKFGKQQIDVKVKRPKGEPYDPKYYVGSGLVYEYASQQQAAPQQAYQPQQPQQAYQPQPTQSQQPSFPIGQAQLNEDDFPF